MSEHVLGKVIKGEYGHTLVVGPPDRPEPVREEVRNLSRKELKKKFGASDAGLEEIMATPGFPPSTARRQALGEWVVTLLWSEHVVDRWVEEQRAMAAKITRLLG